MSETAYLPDEPLAPIGTLEPVLQTSPALVELWDEAGLFDDDSLTAAHADAAEELLELSVRTDAEQSARDELANKALGLIVSATESPFSDASRQMALVQQLVSRIGHLCSGEEAQRVIDTHMHANLQLEAETDTETNDEENQYPRRSRQTAASAAKPAGSLLLRPLLGNLRKLLMPFVR